MIFSEGTWFFKKLAKLTHVFNLKLEDEMVFFQDLTQSNLGKSRTFCSRTLIASRHNLKVQDIRTKRLQFSNHSEHEPVGEIHETT